MTTSLRLGTWPDAMHVAQHMRAEDAAECAAGGLNPMQAVVQSVDISVAWWAWEVNAVPACVFGYSLPTLLGGELRPWLLTTPLVEQHKFAFARDSRAVLEVLRARFPVIRGTVDARYMTCIRWLRWLGFLVFAEPIMVNGNVFHEYRLMR